MTPHMAKIVPHGASHSKNLTYSSSSPTEVLWIVPHIRYTDPDMTDARPPRRYRFGVFEADSTTGELRRKGVRIKLHSQPFQVLFMLLERPGEMLTREEICRELWPGGTFGDYEHGVNSAVNRLREALGDKASNPRFVETLARRGYRFLAPVERVGLEEEAAQIKEEPTPAASHLLATAEDLPK